MPDFTFDCIGHFGVQLGLASAGVRTMRKHAATMRQKDPELDLEVQSCLAVSGRRTIPQGGALCPRIDETR